MFGNWWYLGRNHWGLQVRCPSLWSSPRSEQLSRCHTRWYHWWFGLFDGSGIVDLVAEEEEGQDAAGANNDYWQDHHGQEEGFRGEPQYSGTRKMKTSQKLQDMLKHVGGSGLQQQQEEEHEEERTADCWQDDEDEECLFPDDEPNHFSDNPKRTDRKISNSYEI
mmetsp:Transcript_41385/g.99698  ORF Transcript_41385/g.99698 Transcript_41385/m.99698 type:complete len:165 (-) Transcript_41385:345-839(-)